MARELAADCEPLGNGGACFSGFVREHNRKPGDDDGNLSGTRRSDRQAVHGIVLAVVIHAFPTQQRRQNSEIVFHV
ncbi:MAG: hypothetical protein ACU85U_16905 [Gammaproteobacteria bacterium]